MSKVGCVALVVSKVGCVALVSTSSAKGLQSHCCSHFLELWKGLVERWLVDDAEHLATLNAKCPQWVRAMKRPALEQAWIKHDDAGFASYGSVVHSNYKNKKRPRQEDVQDDVSPLEGQSPGQLLLEEGQSPGSQRIS